MLTENARLVAHEIYCDTLSDLDGQNLTTLGQTTISDFSDWGAGLVYRTVSVDFAEVKVIKSSLLYLPIYWVPFSKLKSIRLFSRSPFCFSGVEDDFAKYKEIMKKWSGTCHVFRVDTNNGKNWKPLGETSGGIQVQVNLRGIKTLTDGVLLNEVMIFQDDPSWPVMTRFQILLSYDSIVACTSAKFVQLNASENGEVFGFGFRKEDDRQAFQNNIQVTFAWNRYGNNELGWSFNQW